ncbi:hypothetical protein OROHE_001322 [Orobanche hederae]
MIILKEELPKCLPILADRMVNEITRLKTMKAIENLDPDHHCLEYLNNKLSVEI